MYETLPGEVEGSDEAEARGGGGITGSGGGSSMFPPPDMDTGDTLGWDAGRGALGGVDAAGGCGCREESGGARGGLDMAAGSCFPPKSAGYSAGPKTLASAVVWGARSSRAAPFLTFYAFASADFVSKLSTMTLNLAFLTHKIKRDRILIILHF